jgi:hypothetical protein
VGPVQLGDERECGLLLKAVCAEAGYRRTMYLDTVAPAWSSNTLGFGFEERAATTAEYAGETVTVYRFLRPPR